MRKLAEGARWFNQALRRGKLVIKRKAARLRRKYKKVGVIVKPAAAHKIVRVNVRSQTAPPKPRVNAEVNFRCQTDYNRTVGCVHRVPYATECSRPPSTKEKPAELAAGNMIDLLRFLS